MKQETIRPFVEKVAEANFEDQKTRENFVSQIIAIINHPDLYAYCRWGLPLSVVYLLLWLKLHPNKKYIHNLPPPGTVLSTKEFIVLNARLWTYGHFTIMDPARVRYIWKSFQKYLPELSTHIETQAWLHPPRRAIDELNEKLERAQAEAAAAEANISCYEDEIEFEVLNDDVKTLQKELEKATREYEEKKADWWFGSAFEDAPPCPISYSRLKEILQSEVQQRTPLWLYIRRYFIGATGLKDLDGLGQKMKTPAKPHKAPLKLLGLDLPEVFSSYVRRALKHGSVFEDMACIGYENLILSYDEDVLGEAERLEMGMAPVPYVINMAQSPDGVLLVKDKKGTKTVGMIEIKCQYMRNSCYPTCPNDYVSQCIQGSIAFGVEWCDFVSMFYNFDPVGKIAPDRTKEDVQLTVERLYITPRLKKKFIRVMVAFQFFSQACAGALLASIQKLPSESAAIALVRFLHAHIQTLQHELIIEIENMKREHQLCPFGDPEVPDEQKLCQKWLLTKREFFGCIKENFDTKEDYLERVKLAKYWMNLKIEHEPWVRPNPKEEKGDRDSDEDVTEVDEPAEKELPEFIAHARLYWDKLFAHLPPPTRARAKKTTGRLTKETNESKYMQQPYLNKLH